MWMMRPPPWRAHRRQHGLAGEEGGGEVHLAPRGSKSSRVKVPKGLRQRMPALLTSTSMRPARASAVADHPLGLAGHGQVGEQPSAAGAPRAAAFGRGRGRVPPRCLPRRAAGRSHARRGRRPHSRPMPREAPVTRATLGATSGMGRVLLRGQSRRTVALSAAQRSPTASPVVMAGAPPVFALSEMSVVPSGSSTRRRSVAPM